MTWEYQPILNSLLQILTTLCIGILAGILDIIPADEFVTQATAFVFYVALPALITKGIGLGVDFYDDKYIWEYIGAFLVLRILALVLALMIILLINYNEKCRVKGLGHVAVMWLLFTWISTVILGVPICTAVFGDAKLGIKYGILAGISSFIFQLPVQLLFFECHAAEEKERTIHLNNDNHVQVVYPMDDDDDDDDDVTDATTPIPIQDTKTTPDVEGQSVGDNGSKEDALSSSDYHTEWWYLVHAENLSNASLWLKIANRVVRNPVVLGIAAGFILSLSTAGVYLRCPSDTCILGLAWIGDTLGWLGDCVTPISLFIMGLWMHEQGAKQLLCMRIRKLSLCMFSKLVAVPLIMVGLANGMNLNDEAGRASILIASLPISMASFSLGEKYNIGQKDLATNVAVGTLLMLPTVLCWNIVLDTIGLYPISSK